MCGRFTLESAGVEIRDEFDLATWPADRGPRYNIAPTQEVAAIVHADGDRQLVWPRWGLVPAWADDPRIGNRMINARAETVAEKPAFRGAFRSRRCLVLADSFYEWQARPDGKQPWRVRYRQGRPFAMAGLWERRVRAGEAPLLSCTILTTTANDLMRPIHDRMPVILPPEIRERWLDDDASPDMLRALLRPCDPDDLDAYPVSTLVNSPRNDLPECCAPL
jgi:putative SOS response-associated peptidase YedK